MAEITYADKNKAGSAPANQWLDVDANEVKASVNHVYDVNTIGVFAHLVTPAGTSIAEAETYVPIEGMFSNDPSEGFTAVATPAIQYEGTNTLYFEIDAHATVKASASSATIRAGIKVNGVLVTASVMSIFAKTAGESCNFSGTSVIQLETDDEVQLVVTCDKVCTVTFDNITATIRPFLLA